MQHEDEEAVQSQGVDEDSERETWLNQIALASLRAADKLSSIQQVCLILTPLYYSAKVSAFEIHPRMRPLPDCQPSCHAHCHPHTSVIFQCMPSTPQGSLPDWCAGTGCAQACSVVA